MFKQQARELLSQAMQTLWANKFRSFLTVLGVVIGTATVISVASLAKGMESGFKEQIEQFGANTAFVGRWKGGPRGRLTPEERKRKPLVLDDAIAISQLPSVVASSPMIRPPGMPPPVKFQGNEMKTSQLRGVSADYANTREVSIKEGRFFNETEDEQTIEVCVIGSNIADKLFDGYDPIGKDIQIANKVFRVVGILAKAKSVFGGPRMDDVIFLPYSTLRNMYPNVEEHNVIASAKQGQLDKMMDDITDLMRRRRNVPYNQEPDFAITTPSGIIDSFNGILWVASMIVIPIVSVALLIGGIGVMNIMLVSVTERTKEIGIRRAIGARRKDIIQQFLLEAAALTGLGGLLGILIGIGISLLINLVAPSLPSRVPILWVAIGFSASVVIGLLAGMYPAIKASRLDPIDALRYE